MGGLGQVANSGLIPNILPHPKLIYEPWEVQVIG